MRPITNKFPRITGFELQEQVIKTHSASYKCAFTRINFRMKSTIRKSLITLQGEQRLLIQINVGIADTFPQEKNDYSLFLLIDVLE